MSPGRGDRILLLGLFLSPLPGLSTIPITQPRAALRWPGATLWTPLRGAHLGFSHRSWGQIRNVSKIEPPMNSLRIELSGMGSGDTGRNHCSRDNRRLASR